MRPNCHRAPGIPPGRISPSTWKYGRVKSRVGSNSSKRNKSPTHIENNTSDRIEQNVRGKDS